MDQFIQHGKTTCLSHSIAVSYYSFALCRGLHLACDGYSVIRGALLHDFFLYDWHEKRQDHKLHGFTHPKRALFNAQRYFQLNDIEKDVIVKHMWPMTLRPPRFKESLVVCLVDKGCSLLETLHIKRGQVYSLRPGPGEAV